MTTLYKLTDSQGRTRGGAQWSEGVSHSATGSPDQDLCSDGWIHAYEHPLLAALLNPIGANFANPQLWEAEGEIGKREGQLLKCGCRSLTTIRRMEMPVISVTQKVTFAILCAKAVTEDKAWLGWADKWLSGEDRAWAAARAAAWAAARAAAWAAEAAAQAAAEAAAQAAEAAAEAAQAAAAAAWAAAEAAAWAARAAAWEARAAAWEARAAELPLDLIAIAQRAMQEARETV